MSHSSLPVPERLPRPARVATALLALVVVAAGGAVLHASSPRFFTAASQTDFLKGDVDNLSIDSHGRLVLGPAAELVYETAAPFVWALLPASDGSLFVGTGNEGKVFKIGPDGKGALFFDSGELEAHALALAPDGGLYVGTSPDGKIYKVARDGTSTTFFDPTDKYVWALVVDSKGVVYAGTGEKAIVYRITPDGQGTPFYKPSATNVTSLAFDHDGNLLVGTESPGRVVRVDSKGSPFVLLDSPFQEIHALRVDASGTVYATALSGRASGGTSTGEAPPPERTTDTARTPVPSVSAEITSISIVDVSGASTTQESPREDRRPASGAVYRIAPDGEWDQTWESKDDSPYDLALDRDGRVVVGTGNKGKIYRLEGEHGEPILLARASAQQVTAMYRDAGGRLYYATANPGKVFRLSSTPAERGTYESEPRDAEFVSSWGALVWHGSTAQGDAIEVFTRSGNTKTPDDGWSPWSQVGARSQEGAIRSPKARYLQWRAVLTGRTPQLTSMSVAYLQRNLRPEVHSITLHAPGIVFQKPFSTGEPDLAGFEDQTTPERKLTNAAMTAQQAGLSPPLGRRSYQKGLQTFAWKADDPNDDELAYDLLYRREGQTTWTTLQRGIDDLIYVWDTTTAPNGKYFLKVVASDAPSNPAQSALTGELESDAFTIDNTPPAIKMGAVRIQGGRTTVVVDVVDADSPVGRVEFSQDGTQWRAVFPTDGIADSQQEHYEITVDGELSGRGLIVRATDTMNNVITAQAEPPRRQP
jgi:sugar lactone lactonase YvrE